ncbi:hypothetical protein [Okeania sp. KiyG1]|uniref:hypothetical protein n=1 Tax=Okeania sp. KiyG1 TaxID=2720165 RepID=UPI001921DC5D|nr:hypothetical protein [Okeania sp. KiyG1]GFZ94637.1 hypothetical protein CYANOKiyG1_05390 [Okeania sp. KiyG1]
MSKYTNWIKYLPLGITLIAQPAFGSSTCSFPNPLPPALGSNTIIPFPVPNLSVPCSEAPIYTSPVNSSWTGTWVGTGADLPWRNVGTFNVTGSGTGSGFVGTTTFDFVTNPLPVGTYFNFGDVDNGSATGQEQFILQAFDSSGNLITTNWLSEAFSVRGTSSPTDLPSSGFSSGIYTIDGMNVPGNPLVGFTLASLEEIGTLVIQKNQSNNGFGLRAPTPTENPTDVPETTSLLGLAFIGLMGFIYRRKC